PAAIAPAARPRPAPSATPPPRQGPSSPVPFPRPRRPAPAAPHSPARLTARPPAAAALPGLPAAADTTPAAARGAAQGKGMDNPYTNGPWKRARTGPCRAHGRHKPQPPPAIIGTSEKTRQSPRPRPSTGALAGGTTPLIRCWRERATLSGSHFRLDKGFPVTYACAGPGRGPPSVRPHSGASDGSRGTDHRFLRAAPHGRRAQDTAS